MEKRMNLKELRDALNKLPEDYLEDSSIAIDFATSDSPDGEFHLMTLWGNHYEDECDDSLHNIWESNEMKIINKRLLPFLNKDLKQAKLREGEKDFDEEYNTEGDW